MIIKIKLKTKEVELTVEEAKELRTQLNQLIEEKTVTVPYYVPNTVPYTVPNTPYWTSSIGSTGTTPTTPINHFGIQATLSATQ